MIIRVSLEFCVNWLIPPTGMGSPDIKFLTVFQRLMKNIQKCPFYRDLKIKDKKSKWTQLSKLFTSVHRWKIIPRAKWFCRRILHITCFLNIWYIYFCSIWWLLLTQWILTLDRWFHDHWKVPNGYHKKTLITRLTLVAVRLSYIISYTVRRHMCNILLKNCIIFNTHHCRFCISKCHV